MLITRNSHTALFLWMAVGYSPALLLLSPHTLHQASPALLTSRRKPNAARRKRLHCNQPLQLPSLSAGRTHAGSRAAQAPCSPSAATQCPGGSHLGAGPARRQAPSAAQSQHAPRRHTGRRETGRPGAPQPTVGPRAGDWREG